MIEHNILYLIWKNPNTRRNYTVGRLEKSDKGYIFEYFQESELAVESGWGRLEAFPLEQQYNSDSLFATFSSRLPDPKRRNIDEVLDKYGLEEYDGFELLRKSGGRLPIDTYEFIDPIFAEDKTVYREFYIVGIRHLSGCNGNDCAALPEVNVGDKLKLQMEPENQYDDKAVIIMNEAGEYLGYIPRYYSESVTDRLIKNMSYDCEVIDVVADGYCEDCIKISLQMPKL